MLGRSALLAATNSENFGNWLGNYSDVSLLLRGNGIPAVVNPPLDESPTPKTITAVGNASVTTAVARWNQGSGGSSLAFDGSEDYLTIPHDNIFNFGSSNFTIEFWIYPNTIANLQVVYYKSTIDGRGVVVAYSNTGPGQINFYADWNSGGPLLNSTNTISAIVWSHVACVRNGSTWTIYINGVASGSTTSSLSVSDTSDNVTIGRFIPSNPSTLNGYIDDLRITKGIARYETGTGANAGKMVFAGTNDLAVPNNFGEFQTNSGPNPDPNWNSVSLLLRNGTPLLVPLDESPAPKTITTTGSASVTTTVFKYGTSSLNFDGTNSVFTAAYSSGYDLSGFDFTIEFWIRPVAFGNQTPITHGNGNGGGGAGGGINSGYRIDIVSGNPRWYINSVNAIVSTINLVTGSWQHVAVCRSGTTTRMFINGVLAGSTAATFTNPTSQPLLIGALANSSFYFPINGQMDDIRITKGIARYNSNFTPAPAELPNF